MAGGILALISRGTGPLRMCLALRRKTALLQKLVRRADIVTAVETQMPAAVLGTDVLDLFSGRLRRLLEVSAYEEDARGRRETGRLGPATESLPAGSSAQVRGAATSPSTLPPSGYLAGMDTGHAAGTTSRRARARPPDRRSTPRGPSQLSAFEPGRTEAAASEKPADMDVLRHRSETPSVSDGNSVPPMRAERRPTAPMLVRMLEEYWRLSDPQGDFRGSTGSPTEAVSGGPGATARPALDSSAASAQPAWIKMTGDWAARKIRFAGSGPLGASSREHAKLDSSAASARPAWIKMTGDWAARKIRFAGSGSLGASSRERAKQRIINGPAENVEIHNVFQLSMDARPGREANRAMELAEEIAGILHEQALQHGIDVT